MKEETRRTFEYHFRTATYHSFTEIVTGLRTVIGHLIQVRMQACHDSKWILFLAHRIFFVIKAKSGMPH